MPTFQPSILPAGAYRVSNKNHDYWIVDADGNIIGQTGANGQDTFFASYQTDSNGNVVGLLGPGGEDIPNKKRTSRNLMIVGDSILANYCLGGTPQTFTDNGDGTATITFSGSHQFWVGAPIRVNGATETKYNTQRSVVTAQVNSGTFSVTYPMTTVNSQVTGSAQCGMLLRPVSTAIVPWLIGKLANPVNLINVAAGGATSEQAEYLLSSWRAENPLTPVDDVIVSSGYNDIYVFSSSFADTQAELISLLESVAAIGSNVYVLLIPPNHTYDAEKEPIHIRINKWLFWYCKQQGFMPIDTWRSKQGGATFINSAGANATPTATFNQSASVHPDTRGSMAIAADLAAAMAGDYPGQFVASHSAATSSNNAILNSVFAGTGGTVTPGGGSISGTAPNSWTISNTSGAPNLAVTTPARTVAADGDANGDNVQIVVTASTGVFRLETTASFHASLVAGEKRRLRVPLTLTGIAGFTGIEAYVFAANATVGNQQPAAIVDLGQATAGDWSGILQFPEDWEIKTGITDAKATIRFTISTGSGTIIIGPPTLDLIEP